MELWHILVLSAGRLGLDADYDRLDDFASHHKLIRQIRGVVETAIGEDKRFSRHSIKGNASLLDEETVNKINKVNNYRKNNDERKITAVEREFIWYVLVINLA